MSQYYTKLSLLCRCMFSVHRLS